MFITSMFNKVAALTPGAFFRFEVTASGQLSFYNLSDKIEAIAGLKRKELEHCSDNLFNRIPESYRKQLFADINQSSSSLADLHSLFPIHTEHRGEIWLDARARPKRGGKGITRWLGFVFDVTETQTIYHQTANQAQLAHFILDNMLDAIVTTDEHGVIDYINNVTSDIFGHSPSELVGKNINVLLANHHRKAHDHYLADYQRTGEQHIIGHNRRLEAVDKDGRTVPIELRVSEFENGAGICFMGVMRDLRPSASIKRQLKQAQQHDPTTGLLNRDGFIQALGHALNTCITGDVRYFALLSIDIDDFDLINKGFGINAGDSVITTVAERLQALGAIAAARIHKDEFALLIEISSETASVNGFLDSMRKYAEKVVNIGWQQISFHFSVGISLFDSTHTASASELLHQSQSALRFAKKEARGGFWVYDPLVSADSKLTAIIDQKLKSATLSNELYLVFQPQFINQREITGYEALLRWENQGIQIPPDQFIPLAERNGSIIEIGDWLVEEACRILGANNHWFLAANKRLSINISPKQFRQPNFVGTIQRALSKYKVDPKLLRLELTERLLIESVGEVVDKMLALNKLGVTFSLDDFGTGFSSLSYLSKLPLAELKIDKSFVNNLQPNTGNYQIVQAVISLSKSLGLDVIAEGVETQEEYSLLKALGCHCYQGYLFARPTRLEALPEIAAQGAGTHFDA